MCNMGPGSDAHTLELIGVLQMFYLGILTDFSMKMIFIHYQGAI